MAAKSAPTTKKAETTEKPEKAAPKPKKPDLKKDADPKGNALQRPVEPSEELAAVIGAGTHTRADVTSKVWAHIKKHDLQNPDNKREIVADDKLKKIFGKDRVTMFEMTKLLQSHMK